MGSPIPNLVADIFLERYEEKHMKQLLDTKNIALYSRYVDDILIIYDNENPNPNHQHTHKSNS
jgi:hypothetical protein